MMKFLYLMTVFSAGFISQTESFSLQVSPKATKISKFHQLPSSALFASESDETFFFAKKQEVPKKSEDDQAAAEGDQAAAERVDPAAGVPQSSRQQPAPQQQPRRLDPLVKSLTTDNASSTDKGMSRDNFIIVPVAAFAALGLAMSVYVGINSQDDFVEALQNNPILQSKQAPLDPGDGCRGICTQEESLDQISKFMNSLVNKGDQQSVEAEVSSTTAPVTTEPAASELLETSATAE